MKPDALPASANNDFRMLHDGARAFVLAPAGAAPVAAAPDTPEPMLAGILVNRCSAGQAGGGLSHLMHAARRCDQPPNASAARDDVLFSSQQVVTH